MQKMIKGALATARYCRSLAAIFAVLIFSNNLQSQTHFSASHPEIGESPNPEIDAYYNMGFLEEAEQLYSNTSLYQDIRLSNQLSDKVRLNLSSHIEYSKRVQVDTPDQERWFDNAHMKTSFDLGNAGLISAFAGYSISDETFTAYGGSYRFRYDNEHFSITNTADAGYDYFYFWNRVGQDFASETLELKSYGMNLSASYFYGNVRNNYIEGYDEKGRNPNDMLNLGIGYDFFRKPKVNVGIFYQLRNYEHYSPLYYSPQDRSITGLGGYFFDTFGDFYFYGGAGIKEDNNSVFVWNLDAETGYDSEFFSISAGFGRYYDPYYRTVKIFINVTTKF